jgi:hypothetical protein
VSVIHKLITSIWNKEEMPDQWKESIIVQFTRRVNYSEISLLSTSYKFYRISSFHRYALTHMKLLGNISVDFDVIDELLIRFCVFK